MRPFLLLDVDGVLMPTGASVPPGYERHTSATYDVVISGRHGEWLRTLSEMYEPVWATTWGHSAGAIFGPLLGLPQMPVLPLENLPREGTRKLSAVAQFVQDRPLAWIDDELFQDAFEWAANRPAPTLLLRTRGSVGLSEVEYNQLLSFGEDLAEGTVT